MGQKDSFRYNLCVAQAEEGMAEIIQNLIDFAPEGHLAEELFGQDIGIVVCSVLNHLEVFIAQNGGN